MADLGEHIEEMVKVYRNMGDPLDPEKISGDVLDIAVAQGLMSLAESLTDEQELNALNQTKYILGVD